MDNIKSHAIGVSTPYRWHIRLANKSGPPKHKQKELRFRLSLNMQKTVQLNKLRWVFVLSSAYASG